MLRLTVSFNHRFGLFVCVCPLIAEGIKLVKGDADRSFFQCAQIISNSYWCAHSPLRASQLSSGLYHWWPCHARGTPWLSEAFHLHPVDWLALYTIQRGRKYSCAIDFAFYTNWYLSVCLQPRSQIFNTVIALPIPRDFSFSSLAFSVTVLARYWRSFIYQEAQHHWWCLVRKRGSQELWWLV